MNERETYFERHAKYYFDEELTEELTEVNEQQRSS